MTFIHFQPPSRCAGHTDRQTDISKYSLRNKTISIILDAVGNLKESTNTVNTMQNNIVKYISTVQCSTLQYSTVEYTTVK